MCGTNDKQEKKRGTDKASGTPTKDPKEPKAKKPRVTPEKATEVRTKILDQLAQNYKLGITEMDMTSLAYAVGYKHPRSDAFVAGVKLLIQDGLVTKSKDTCMLTEAAIEEHVPKDIPPASPEEALEAHWKNLEIALLSNDKTKGSKANEQATAIWDLLKDGQSHDMKEVLEVTTYKMERSTGFPEIVGALKRLGLANKETVDGTTTLRFTDKLFPFGRP